MRKALFIVVLAGIPLTVALLWRKPARETAEALPNFVPAPAPAFPPLDSSALPSRRRGPLPSATPQLGRAGNAPSARPLKPTDRERLRAMRLSAPPRPGPVPLQHGNYALVPDVYAMPAATFRPSADLYEIERSAGYVFFRVDAGAEAPAGALPAAMHTGNHLLGAVTGLVIAKLDDISLVPAVGSDYRLTTVQIFDHLKLAIYQSGRAGSGELVSLLAAMRNDQRVKEAELEIVNNLPVTQ